MSKTKLLLNVIEDIRRLGDSLQELHDVMISGEETKESKKETNNTQVETLVNSTEKVQGLSRVSLEEVRTVLAKKSQEGKTALVRELIESYGVSKLSEVDEKYYEDLIKRAEDI